MYNKDVVLEAHKVGRLIRHSFLIFYKWSKLTNMTFCVFMSYSDMSSTTVL